MKLKQLFNSVMNKGKAVLTALAILVVFYLAKPVVVTFEALAHGGLFSWTKFKVIFKSDWDYYGDPSFYWDYVKELWIDKK